MRAEPTTPADDSEAGCEHLAVDAAAPTAKGCEDCLRVGGEWFHLRLCLGCGHVGCCDRSPGQHATAHFRATGHPAIRSFDAGESWRWCSIDEIAVGLDEPEPAVTAEAADRRTAGPPVRSI